MPHRRRRPPGVLRVTIAPKQIKFTF